MIKQIGIYLVSFMLLLLIGFNSHQLILSQLAIDTPFSLKKVYVFHGAFSLLLCTNFFLLFHTKKFKDQLGFLYLVSVALKIILFCIVFSEHIFTEDSFTQTDGINFLIPMAVMLFLEVFFINKLLKKSSPVKNTK
ncbi:hypothetical protein GTQ40_11810 [Flavobacteriaceae bacterium R38]|nr:hypothetical protein [Flavobacteriaceae bacterium R38]